MEQGHLRLRYALVLTILAVAIAVPLRLRAITRSQTALQQARAASLSPPPNLPLTVSGARNAELLSGWQLLSVPQIQSEPAPSDVFASLDGVLRQVVAYDNCASGEKWQVYDVDSAENTLTTIDPTKGLWVETDQPATFEPSGIPATSLSIQMCPGWNLIGYPLPDNTVTDALAPIAGKYVRVFGFDPADTDDPWAVFDVDVPTWVNDLTMLEQGGGYWIYATDYAVLQLAQPAPTATPSPTPSPGPSPTPTETPTPDPNATATPVPTQTPMPTPTTVPAQPPFTAILWPTDGMTITTQTDIRGTILGDDLTSWRLEYAVVDDANWTTIVTGTTAIDDGLLAEFDPTLLINGIYNIRLVAENTTGQIVSETITVVVEGGKKVGNFSLSFVDVNIPVMGVPIQVIRTYDSRDKQMGDFGVGWRLALQDVEVQENSIMGEGWEQTSQRNGFFTQYCVVETQSHVVVVRSGDELFKFRPKPSPQCQVLLPIQQVTFEFEPLPGTFATLNSLDNNLLFTSGTNGPIELLSSDLSLFDPDNYELITRDGRTLVIDQVDGLESMSDRNGNTLTFNENGIVHSTGKSISFDRDAEGRITQITDPLGHTMRYGYNGAGDLVEVEDQESYTTTMVYDDAHYLIDIVDARGVRAIRNEFDDDGRLIRNTDADGNVISYTHNIVDNETVVVDQSGRPTTIAYDDLGNVVSEQDAEGMEVTATYDLFGYQTSDIDEAGRVRVYGYDSEQNLTTYTHVTGATLHMSYDDSGRITSFTNTNGATSYSTYDDNGQLIAATDPLGNVSRVTYNEDGTTASAEDALGNITHFEYDEFGNSTKVVNPAGLSTFIIYDDNNRPLSTSITQTLFTGEVVTVTTRFVYDRIGNLIETVMPDGSTTRTIYDHAGRISAEINALGNETQFEYDSLGRVTQVIYSDGSMEQTTYDSVGNPLTITSRDGSETRFEYNARSEQIATIIPISGSITATTQTQYNEFGQIIASVDSLGNISQRGYNEFGLLETITNAVGATATFRFDNENNPIETSISGQKIKRQFDDNGQLTQVDYGQGISTTTLFDPVGRISALIDPEGNKVSYQYDELGRLISVTDPMSNTTSFSYDEVGNLIIQTDPLNSSVRHTYDLLGRPTGRTLSTGQQSHTTYDAVGNITSATDFNGQEIQYTYDALNQLISKTFPNDTTVEYSYDLRGNIVAISDTYGTHTLQYNKADLLLRADYPSGDTIRYEYDLGGNLILVESPAGSVAYTYDALGRLKTVTDPDNGVTTYTYDNFGNTSSVSYPNGTYTTYQYDHVNRLTRLEHYIGDDSLLAGYQYTLGKTGERLSVVDHNGRRVDYVYDDNYRLLSESVTDPLFGDSSILYSYDAAGNRLTRTENNVTTSYAYDANGWLASDGTYTYAYDGNGNTIERNDLNGTVTNYSYDFDNRLTDIIVKVNGVETSYITYQYDALGNRIRSDVNGTITNYLVDTNQRYAQVLLETDGAGNHLASYVYGNDLLSMETGSERYYYHYDGQSSTRLLTNNAGAVTDEYTFDAFGNLLVRVGSTENNYLYTGEQYDPNVGFYYLRARYMNPEVGRFLTMDTYLGSPWDPISLHLYTYVQNNPVNAIDPSGNVSITETLQVVQTASRFIQLVNNVFNLISVFNQASELLYLIDTAYRMSRAWGFVVAAADVASFEGEALLDNGSEFVWRDRSKCRYWDVYVRWTSSAVSLELEEPVQCSSFSGISELVVSLDVEGGLTIEGAFGGETELVKHSFAKGTELGEAVILGTLTTRGGLSTVHGFTATPVELEIVGELNIATKNVFNLSIFTFTGSVGKPERCEGGGLTKYILPKGSFSCS